MKLSAEAGASIRKLLQIAVVVPIGFVGGGCVVEAGQQEQKPAATIIAINDGKNGRVYRIIPTDQDPEHDLAATSILCERPGRKPPALFPRRANESLVKRQCETIQPVVIEQKPKNGQYMIEGVHYAVLGPPQTVPLP